MENPIQQHPDYHEGFHLGVHAAVDNLRSPYETTHEYCEGYNAGHALREWVRADALTNYERFQSRFPTVARQPLPPA